ncbi:MAG TPA: sigma 54-interacting transcriptional regulator [Candidatus Limnocylindria bacterium]|nr:sigma 54-interacting transcriptional regulator [Candidatus Limnocylindria bacterium]
MFEGTAQETGRRFFAALAEHLARALGVYAAMVTEYDARTGRARTLGFFAGDQRIDHHEYDVAGTPCGVVLRGAQYVHHPADAQQAFPDDEDLRRLDVVSYMGVPLHDARGAVLGHLAVMDRAPMTDEPRHLALFHLFARRAAAELQRLRDEAARGGAARADATAAPAGNGNGEQALAALAADFLAAEPYAIGNAEILGRSAALATLLRDVREVAPTDATVLLLGETGTGKELIARAVHEWSARRARPFVRVNCAAIAPSLIESELFGHEQGAFTGATRRRDGRFALAHRGTLLLDEVGELPLELQAKLLRVLQEGEFERVGSSATQRVDVRIVAATNRDLERAVERGEFREDLFYRLNVFPVRLPPLRERGDDVVLLADAFAARVAARLGRRVAPLDAEGARLLQAHHWPGNVRELQNVIERAVITARDGRLDVAHALGGTPASRAAGTPGLAEAADDRIRTVRELRELERNNVLRALDATGWRIAGPSGAAELLGMPASTLASRMKSLGIRRTPAPPA